MGLLCTLKPEWWFSAHLHCRFEAAVVHPPDIATEGNAGVVGTNPDEIAIEDDDEFDEPIPDSDKHAEASTAPPTTRISTNPDEILLDDEEEEVAAPPPPPPPPSQTKFLALDKCLPRRQFLEVRVYTFRSRNRSHLISTGH